LIDRLRRVHTGCAKLLLNAVIVAIPAVAIAALVDRSASEGTRPRTLEPYVGWGELRDATGAIPERERPELSGYQLEGGFHVWEPDAAASSSVTVAGRFGWLFQERAALARDRSRRRLFVLGGSVAHGWSATPGHSFWEVLEHELGPETTVVPAAMGGFGVTQERIALELAVLPLAPSAVLVLDGWNDLVLPGELGARPGDPFDWGIELGRREHPLSDAAARTSRLAAKKREGDLARVLAARAERLVSTPTLLDAYATSVATCYRDGIARLLERCAEAHVPCAVLVQPCRAVTNSRVGAGAAPDPIARLTLAAYGRCLASLPEGAFDLTASLDSSPATYVDECHPDNRGHLLLARAALPIARKLLEPSSERPR
jgi:hypothetical protein